MTPAERHARLTALFSDALDQTPESRSAWLRAHCDDPELRREVAALLAQHDHEVGGPLDHPVFARTALSEHPEEAEPERLEPLVNDPLVGRRVGAWRVTGVLGRGGMGSVYSAERADESFTQHAALKLVRLGLHPDFEPRFVHERSLLASLDHPGIARFLDGGVAPDGTPFLALELVEGAPITTYAASLGLEDRLRLFLRAAEAVAYAHRNLVVHRDLKPDHILVTENDRGEPHVKLLDFGIAKLLASDDREVLTQTGTGPLTPPYAAPEQLLAQGVTTATDVYALGVVLYELLTGRRPYDLTDLTAAQVERIICETVPPRPSEVALDDTKALRGDLDAVVLKALAKEPERRYASADALADDLSRYLDGLPVRARPDTAGYRVRKFVRRHRVAVGAAAGVVALVAVLSTFYALRLTAERDRAQQAAHLAQEEAERAEAIAGFLEQILRAPNTRWYNDAEATGPDTPIRAVLDEAATRVAADFADRPDLRADLHHLLGDTYLALGLTAETGMHHRAALALRESLYTPPHPKIAEALYYAAWYVSDEPNDWATRTRVLRRAVAMQRARNEGNNFPFMIQPLADAYLLTGQPAHADSLLGEALVFTDQTFRPGHDGHRYREILLAALTRERAHAHLDLGRTDAAARWLAYGDSVLARLPRQSGHLATWRAQRCVAGRLLRLRSHYVDAERALLACLGHQTPQADVPPFLGTVSAYRDHLLRGEAAAELVTLYEAWGRPDEATPYRPETAGFIAERDSLRTVLEAADVLAEPVRAW